MGATVLKEIFNKKNLTLSEVARSCKISSSYLSMIINGHRNNVSIEILEALAEELKITRNDIEGILKTDSHQLKQNLTTRDREQSLSYLGEVLNALEVNDTSEIERLTTMLNQLSEWDSIAQKYAEWYQGWRLTLQNRFLDALLLFNSAKQFRPKTETERRFMAKILSSIGGACVAKGDYKAALDSFRKSLYLWSSGKQVAIVYLNMGTLYRRSHKYALSKQAYEKAIEYGSNFIKMRAYSSLAQTAFDKNNLVMARREILNGYRVARSEQEPRGKDDLYCNIGVYYSMTGRENRAKKWLEKSIELTKKTKNTRTKHYAMAELVDIYLRENNEQKAESLINEIQNELSENNDTLLLATQFCTITKRHFNLKEFERGYLILVRCYSLLQGISPSHELLNCCSLLKKYHQHRREPYVAAFYESEMNRIRSKIAFHKVRSY